MSTGQLAFECPTCGDATARRGECLSCATQRREAALWAQGKAAEIRVKNRVELPQHVEPVAPVRTREVVRIRVAAEPEKPARAPTAVQAAPAMPRSAAAPVAALKLNTVSVGQYRERWVGGAPVPRKKLPMVVGKLVRGQCRIDGCVRNARTRGLCEGCAGQAREEGVFEQVAAAAVRADAGLLVAAVVEEVRRKPGRTIRQIGPLNGRSFESTREAAYAAVNAGKLVRKGALYYLPGAS